MNNKSNFYIVVYFLTLALSNNASFAVLGGDGKGGVKLDTIAEETAEELEEADAEVDAVEADADDLVVDSAEKRYYDFAKSLDGLSEAQAESFIDYLRTNQASSWSEYTFHSLIMPEGTVNLELLGKLEESYDSWSSRYGKTPEQQLYKDMSTYSQFGYRLFTSFGFKFPDKQPGVFLSKENALSELPSFKAVIHESGKKPEEMGLDILRARPMYGLPVGFYEHYVTNKRLLSDNEVKQAILGRPSRNTERFLNSWNRGYIHNDQSSPAVNRTLSSSPGVVIPSHLQGKSKTGPFNDANENHYWKLAPTNGGQIKEDVMFTVKWVKDKYPGDNNVQALSNKLSLSEIRSLVGSSGINDQDKTRVLEILPTDEKMRTLKGNGFNSNAPLSYIVVPPRVTRSSSPVVPSGGGSSVSGGSAPYKRLVGPLPPKILLPDDSTRTKSKLRPEAKKKK